MVALCNVSKENVYEIKTLWMGFAAHFASSFLHLEELHHPRQGKSFL